MSKIYLLASTLLIFLSFSAVDVLGFTCLHDSPASESYIRSQGLPTEGEFLMAKAVQDGHGKHLLILSRKMGRPGLTAPHRIDYVELRADYYTRTKNAWFHEWVIRDLVDCPKLDVLAQFFLEYVSVTDLNFNQRAEITVPYQLFCGGDVDSSVIKVVMREAQ